MSNKVKLISVTPEAEKIMAYCARVSSPNQDNPDYEKLLEYCMKHGHWSVFEMADMTVEIETSRAISPQILRHRSFSFQEFSQRYAEVQEFESISPRRQDTKNRQNSIDDLSAEDKTWFLEVQANIEKVCMDAYKGALKMGIAKECARALLPMSAKTRLYMKGSVRSWIHYLQVRCDPSTQREHREIAFAIYYIFMQQFPTVGKLIMTQGG